MRHLKIDGIKKETIHSEARVIEHNLRILCVSLETENQQLKRQVLQLQALHATECNDSTVEPELITFSRPANTDQLKQAFDTKTHYQEIQSRRLDNLAENGNQNQGIVIPDHED